MLVRPATPADVPAILPMVRQLCDLHEARDPARFRVLPDVLDRYAKWLPERAADPRSVLLVAEVPPDTGTTAAGTVGAAGTGSAAEASGVPRVSGFLVGTIEPEVPIFWIPECGMIHDVWVEPAARRSGLARALVEAAIARYTALGVKQVRLHTAAFNDPARAVFATCGFRPCVVEMLRTLP